MFGPKKEDEVLRKQRQAQLDIMIKRASRLKSLVNSDNSGWKDFFDLLDDYVNACKRRKLATRLDTASPEMIEQLKLLDHEIFILNFVLDIPMRYIDKTENAIAKEREREQREQRHKDQKAGSL